MPEINSKYVSLGTPVKIQLIEESIGRAANVTLEDMRSHKRNPEFAEARMAVWYICYDYLGLSFPAIAKIYGRDHTTIMHGVNKIRKSNAGGKIVEGIKKSHPDALSGHPKGEARTVESWQF